MTGTGTPGTGWPLDWRKLDPRQRWLWWEQLWTDAIRLHERYRLGLRSGWWRDEIQAETLVALAAWATAYDSGASNDAPGKLQLLYDLDRIRPLLHAGQAVFDPQRDRDGFVAHLIAVGCEPPAS